MAAKITQPLPTSPLQPDLVLFARGVIAILKAWPVLRLAVDQQWGGPESAAKRTWVASELVDAFEARGPSLDQDDIEEMVLLSIAEEFDTNVDDGSSTLVARDLIHLWKDIQEGRTSRVDELEKSGDKLMLEKVRAEFEGGNGDSDWEDDIDSDEIPDDVAPALINTSKVVRPREVPQVDEEGFTLVKGKGRK